MDIIPTGETKVIVLFLSLPLLLVMAFLIMPAPVLGESSQATAFVTFTMVNRAPSLTHVSFEPSQPHADERLHCLAEADDELPLSVSYTYLWKVNDRPSRASSGWFGDFKEGDNITCTVFPTDVHGVKGGSLTVKARIAPAPLSTRILDSLLHAAGAKTQLQDTAALQHEGLGAITGFAVRKSIENRPAFPVLGILVLLLSIINLHLLMRRHAFAGIYP
ncbi:MAG: hypothetical protein GXP63_03005 [DPANN group archaeon]|nr:hypothetical protein [DPANN group archaeon]